jgi:hypothetical protein
VNTTNVSNNSDRSTNPNGVDFQPPYFPPPFPGVSHQHPFDQHNLDYTSSSSSPPTFTNNQPTQSYNSLVRSSGVNIDETTNSLSHPYGAYAEYAASYYSRHAMVLDPESLQLYRSGLLGADPGNTPTFRVNFRSIFMISMIISFRFLVLMIMFHQHYPNIIERHSIEVFDQKKRFFFLLS